MSLAFVDYWPPSEDLKVERTSDNTLTFTMAEIWGRDGDVSFDNCAFLLEVNKKAIGPTDRILGDNGYSNGLEVRMFKGSGIYNSSVVSGGNISYIVTMVDLDKNGYASYGDAITLQATEPLLSDACYDLTLITEVNSSWSYGVLKGTYLEVPLS